MTEQLKRGEVWLANLNPTQGSEQAGTRPVIIFQNDIVSQFSTTTIAIPLTTSQRRAALPICLFIAQGELAFTPISSVIFSSLSLLVVILSIIRTYASVTIKISIGVRSKHFSATL